MLKADAPVVLLQHHGLDNLRGKTGLTLLRYRRGPIVAVVDPSQAGRSLVEVSGIDREVPVVASLAEALPYGPEVAVVGLAPSGGRLPEEAREDVKAALAAGLNVASGLHTRLGEDPELAALVQPGRWIWDLRREPEALAVASARAASLPCARVLAVGSDMSVGKMSACLELQAAGLGRGLDARFVGTGQAGILISGSGVALDAVRVDYAAGAGPEALVLVEGQGSFCHPGSTATLPLIRGSQPTALLMVHRASQVSIHNQPQIPLPSLPDLIRAVEAIAALARPAEAAQPAPRVAAIALNTALLEAAEAEEACRETSRQTGLPCRDPVRHGSEELLKAVLLPSGNETLGQTPAV